MPTCITVRRNFVVPSLLEITDPEFVHQYGMGVWWAMFGDYQGNGPYDDRYLIENISRNIQVGRYNNPSSPWFTSLGFYLGMLRGGMLDPATRQLRERNTLVVLTDPDFARGYNQRHQDGQLLTDSIFAQFIHQWALNRITDQALAYELGLLTGALAQMLIPAMLQTA
jgi:hypothetical protein